MKISTMENKINIAEILKDCPKGMKMYSPIYGTVELWKVNSNSVYSIMTATSIDRAGSFTSEGRLYEKYPFAECLLFPSSEMRDWTKFFKRGDVVYIKEANYVTDYAIFESWKNDDYTEFNASIFYSNKSGFAERKVCTAKLYTKANDILKAKLITFIEQHYNGKYNPETLQVEPVKPVCLFKPFDKVLVRDGVDEQWRINIFSHHQEKGGFPYVCMSGVYRDCIPYNEDTAQLLNTTSPYIEGGSE